MNKYSLFFCFNLSFIDHRDYYDCADIRNKYNQISIPTLVFWAEDDPVIPPTCWPDLKDLNNENLCNGELFVYQSNLLNYPPPP